jgi:hypothetical protein
MAHPRWVVEVQHRSILAALYFPAWLAAGAWGRDGHVSRREQISASLLTAEQLIHVRTRLWLVVPAILGLSLFDVRAVSDLAAYLCAPRDSFLSAVHQSVRESVIGSAFFNIIAHGKLVLIGVLLIGLATRFTLLWWWPLLSVALSFACRETLHQASWGFCEGYLRPLAPLSRWTFRHYIGSSFSSPYDFEICVLMAVAVAVWWRLRRHVERVCRMR